MRRKYIEYNCSCDVCGSELRDYGDSTLYSIEERNRQFKKHKWARIKGVDYCEKCKEDKNDSANDNG